MKKKILAIFIAALTLSLMAISVSAESLEVVEEALPPVDPSQTYEVIIIPEETTVMTTVPVVTPAVTTVATTKAPAVTTAATTKAPAVTTAATTKAVSKPVLTQKEIKTVAQTSVVPTQVAFIALKDRI